jgi:hypothetical protein
LKRRAVLGKIPPYVRAYEQAKGGMRMNDSIALDRVMPWHKLPNDYALHFHQPRRRKGQLPPLRFLIYGPHPGKGFRPLIASGNLVCGCCVIDHGVLGTEQVTAVEKIARMEAVSDGKRT